MFHGMPVRSTKRIPARARRSGTRGRPSFACDGGGGSNGSTTAHNPSDTSTSIPPHAANDAMQGRIIHAGFETHSEYSVFRTGTGIRRPRMRGENRGQTPLEKESDPD